MKTIKKPVKLPPKPKPVYEDTPEFYEETMMRVADYFTLVLARLGKDHPDYRTECAKEELEAKAAELFERHASASILVYAVRGAPYHRHAHVGTAYPKGVKPPRMPGHRIPRQWVVGEPGWP